MKLIAEYMADAMKFERLAAGKKIQSSGNSLKSRLSLTENWLRSGRAKSGCSRQKTRPKRALKLRPIPASFPLHDERNRPRVSGAYPQKGHQPFMHLLMKLVLAAPASALPSALLALSSQHFFM
jgi:hypothetical protein